MSYCAVDIDVSFKIPIIDRYSMMILNDDGVPSQCADGYDEESGMIELTESAGSDRLALKVQMGSCAEDDFISADEAKSYAMELAAHEALKLLRDDQDVVVLDYNWYEAEDIRDNSGVLFYKIQTSRNIFEYASSQCFSVLNDLKLVSDSTTHGYGTLLRQVHGHALYTLKECNRRACEFDWKIDTVLKGSYIQILKKRNQASDNGLLISGLVTVTIFFFCSALLFLN